MAGGKRASKCCAILKLQVSHRLWVSLVVCSLYKWKKKYLYMMLRLAVSAFKIQGLICLIIPKRGSSLILPGLMSQVTWLDLEDSLLSYMQDYDIRTQVAALGFMVLGTLQFCVTVLGSPFSLLTTVLSAEVAAPQTSANWKARLSYAIS